MNRNCKYCGQNKEDVLFVTKHKCKDCKRKMHRDYKREVYKVKYKEKHRAETQRYKRERMKRDEQYKINKRIGDKIYFGIAKGRNVPSLTKYVGYRIDELKNHLEKQFDSNTNWDNYGTYWEIDHIIPKSMFKFTSYDDEEFKLCWCLNNLQPLSKERNLFKGGRFIG